MKEKNNKYIGKKLGITFGLFVTLMLVFAIVSIQPEEPEETWHKVAEIKLDALGDYDPGSGASGWIETFMLDYAETPATVLAVNKTDWSVEGTADGYVDADAQDIDLASENGAYFVVRCRFNATVKDGADFIGKRCRCTLTVSGDETIAGVTQYGYNTTDTTGGGIVSMNKTTEPYIWINFFWDDNSDGYRITDDGGLEWSITIEAKY